jgi:hypothetical protein
MWGSSQILTLSQGVFQSRQLVKINYKRPETWSFFFGAKILTATAPGPTLTLEVAFEVIAGVGRTLFNTTPPGGGLATSGRGFAFFLFTLPIPFVQTQGTSKYTTVGRGPAQDDTLPLVVPSIEWIPAQDIQVMAGARSTPSVNVTATIEVTSFFAPRSHVRPDWFGEEPVAQFLGGERNGT